MKKICKNCGCEVVDAIYGKGKICEAVKLKNGKYANHDKFCEKIRQRKTRQEPLLKIPVKYND